jgi:hypothetical protein
LDGICRNDRVIDRKSDRSERSSAGTYDRFDRFHAREDENGSKLVPTYPRVMKIDPNLDRIGDRFDRSAGREEEIYRTDRPLQ